MDLVDHSRRVGQRVGRSGRHARALGDRLAASAGLRDRIHGVILRHRFHDLSMLRSGRVVSADLRAVNPAQSSRKAREPLWARTSPDGDPPLICDTLATSNQAFVCDCLGYHVLDFQIHFLYELARFFTTSAGNVFRSVNATRLGFSLNNCRSVRLTRPKSAGLGLHVSFDKHDTFFPRRCF